MRKTALILAVLLIAVAPLLAQSAQTRAAATAVPVAAARSIDPQKIRAHVKFLASDQLEGRGTGQRGGDIAAEYIATQFALYGLQPAGDKGTYMQAVPLSLITPLPQTTFSVVPAKGPALDLRFSE